jgi:protocatechuate 3,4-dioxygenase beta subunit
MTNDDAPVGRLLTRRETLALLGITGAGLLLGGAAMAAAATAPCVVRPEQTEGPFFVDERLDRSDIRSDPATGLVRPGIPLAIAFQVSQVEGSRCRPLEGARVEVWHCDAHGAYSDVRDGRADTTGQKFLRGYQRTDASGLARFRTIYPGWYAGRTVHVHFKVVTPAEADRAHEFVSQLYFDDALTDRVHARAPYASQGKRRIRNAGDGIFRHGGDRLTLALVERGSGYEGRFDLGLAL